MKVRPNLAPAHWRLLIVAALGMGLVPVTSAQHGTGKQGTARDGGVADGNAPREAQRGWLNWRGPAQNGTSGETGLIDAPVLRAEGGSSDGASRGDRANLAWTFDMAGRGTPVVAGGRVFGMGYDGEGKTLQEVLFCLDEATGKPLWERRFSDFLSDVIYTRYSIGSPTIDPQTGNLFAVTAPGLLQGFTADGDALWQRSLMEELGRLSFPNGRVGAPLIVGDLVIVHFIFAAWGRDFGPARDRFYAFDKHTGEVVWGATPGGPPKDSSFSMPIVEQRGGRTLMYAGLGGGHVCCMDALTGDVLWRYPLAIGGINSSALIHGDKLIVIHGKENRDSSVIGRMVALDLTAEPSDDGVLPTSAELWRNDLVAFTSSPVLVGGRAYAMTATGDLNCVDVTSGEVLWHEKLGDSQLHASPTFAEGKLYIPMADGSFHVIRPTDAGAQRLGVAQLGGSCLGAPAISGGRVYVHSTEKLYCFAGELGVAPAWPADIGGTRSTKLGPPARLQLVPFDQSVRVGEPLKVSVRRLDAAGRFVDMAPTTELEFGLAARQKDPLAVQGDDGQWVASSPGTGTLSVKLGDLMANGRIRVVPALPFTQDFSSVVLNQAEGRFAFPAGQWLGGHAKWQVVDKDGERLVQRNLANPLFQRTMTLISDPDDANYTVQVDLMSDGGRRTLSSAGVINQRYLIVLKGNHQELEVSSNMEHLKIAVPYRWKAKVWYTLRTRVDMQPDGSALIRAKVWPRASAEPEAWTIEVNDPHGHESGAAGLYGFTPQSRFAVYLDNLRVTPND